MLCVCVCVCVCTDKYRRFGESNFYLLGKNIKVKDSRNRPGVAQRVPGGLDSQISMTFGTWRWWGCQPHAPAAFAPRKCSWYSFSLGAESTPGPWYGRKEYVTGKSSDTTGNRSRDRPTSSAVHHPKSLIFWVDPENEDTSMLRNLWNYSSEDTMSYLRHFDLQQVRCDLKIAVILDVTRCSLVYTTQNMESVCCYVTFHTT